MWARIFGRTNPKGNPSKNASENIDLCRTPQCDQPNAPVVATHKKRFSRIRIRRLSAACNSVGARLRKATGNLQTAVDIETAPEYATANLDEPMLQQPSASASCLEVTDATTEKLRSNSSDVRADVGGESATCARAPSEPERVLEVGKRNIDASGQPSAGDEEVANPASLDSKSLMVNPASHVQSRKIHRTSTTRKRLANIGSNIKASSPTKALIRTTKIGKQMPGKSAFKSKPLDGNLEGSIPHQRQPLDNSQPDSPRPESPRSESPREWSPRSGSPKSGSEIQDPRHQRCWLRGDFSFRERLIALKRLDAYIVHHDKYRNAVMDVINLMVDCEMTLNHVNSRKTLSNFQETGSLRAPSLEHILGRATTDLDNDDIRKGIGYYHFSRVSTGNMYNAPNFNLTLHADVHEHPDDVMFFISPSVLLKRHFITCKGNVAKNAIVEAPGRLHSMMKEEDALREALRSVKMLKAMIKKGADKIPIRNEVAVFQGVESDFVYPHLAVLNDSDLPSIKSEYVKGFFEVEPTCSRREAGKEAIRRKAEINSGGKGDLAVSIGGAVEPFDFLFES